MLVEASCECDCGRLSGDMSGNLGRWDRKRGLGRCFIHRRSQCGADYPCLCVSGGAYAAHGSCTDALCAVPFRLYSADLPSHRATADRCTGGCCDSFLWWCGLRVASGRVAGAVRYRLLVFPFIKEKLMKTVTDALPFELPEDEELLWCIKKVSGMDICQGLLWIVSALLLTALCLLPNLLSDGRGYVCAGLLLLPTLILMWAAIQAYRRDRRI